MDQAIYVEVMVHRSAGSLFDFGFRFSNTSRVFDSWPSAVRSWKTYYDENLLVILAMTTSRQLEVPDNQRKHADILCSATTLTMNPTLNTNTTTGSTFNPGLSSV